MPIEQRGYTQEPKDLALSAAVILDPRLAELWQLVWAAYPMGDEGVDAVPCEALGGLLRLAYLQGYSDAAEDPVPGALFDELGVRSVGAVSSQRRSARRRGSGRGKPGSSDR